MNKGWYITGAILGCLLAVAVAIGLFVGSLYAGEWLYEDFGLGGMMLACTLMLMGAIETTNDKRGGKK